MKERDRDNERILKHAKRLYVINLLGGCCSKCGETAPWKLDFHHTRDKEKLVKFAGRLSEILKEAKKCILLCSNCHREHHHKITRPTKSVLIKQKILAHKGTSACECCGYDKNIAALDFHHRNPSDKKFNLSEIGIFIPQSPRKELHEFVKEEADKCLILCANCHGEKHFDLDYYKDNIEKITYKSENLKEQMLPINKEYVKELYDSGLNQKEISKKLNCGKSTISGILKTFGLTKQADDIKTNREEFKNCIDIGYNTKQLQNHFNIEKVTVFSICKELGVKVAKMPRFDPDNGNFKKAKCKLTDEELDEALKIKTASQIARECGCSRAAISRRKNKKRGINNI